MIFSESVDQITDNHEVRALTKIHTFSVPWSEANCRDQSKYGTRCTSPWKSYGINALGWCSRIFHLIAEHSGLPS